MDKSSSRVALPEIVILEIVNDQIFNLLRFVALPFCKPHIGAMQITPHYWFGQENFFYWIPGDKEVGFKMVPKQTATQNEILALLDSHADQKSSLAMTKSYWGMILSQNINTVAVDNHRAVFQALDRNFCAALEGCVHLHSHFLPKPVKSHVRDLSVRRGMFTLSDFSYIEGDWKERLHERVQPKEPTYVSLRYRRIDIRASMLDISLSGMGVLVCNSDDREFEFHPNSSVCTDFQTSPTFRWAKLGGAIHYQQKVSRSIARLGIRLYPKLEQARQLEKYIANRKTEIMEELERASMAAKISSRVEYQYF